MDRRGQEPGATAQNRRPDDPKIRAQDPTRLRQRIKNVDGSSRAVRRIGDVRGCAPLPAPSGGRAGWRAEHSIRPYDVAVLFPGHAEAPRKSSEHTMSFTSPRKLPVVRRWRTCASARLPRRGQVKGRTAPWPMRRTARRRGGLDSRSRNRQQSHDPPRAQGKGGKDRKCRCAALLDILAHGGMAARPQGGLFRAAIRGSRDTRQLNRACHAAPRWRTSTARLACTLTATALPPTARAEHRCQRHPGRSVPQARHQAIYTRGATKTISDHEPGGRHIRTKVKGDSGPPGLTRAECRAGDGGCG